MDSNFQVKITADLGDLVAKIKNIETTLKKLDASFKTVGAKNNLKKTGEEAAVAGLDMNRMRLASFALGQVLRDSGFFAQSFGLGLLAISNNIPILIDQLVMLSGISKGLGAAISLAGSVLTAVLTVWAYSSMAIDRNTESLEKNKNVLEKVKLTGEDYYKTLNNLDQTRLRGTASAQSELTTLRLLYSQYTNLQLPLSKRKEAYDQMQQIYPSVFGNLKFENEITDKVRDAYNGLAQSIIASARARAAADSITKNAIRQYENEQQIIELTTEKLKQQDKAKKDRDKRLASGGDVGDIEITNVELTRKEKLQLEEIDKIQKAINDKKTDSAKLIKQNIFLETLYNDEVKKGGKITDETVKGDGGKSKLEGIRDVYIELAKELKIIKYDTFSSELEKANKLIDVHKTALESLIKLGVSPLSKGYKEVSDSLFKASQALLAIEGKIFSAKMQSTLLSENAAKAVRDEAAAKKKILDEEKQLQEISKYAEQGPDPIVDKNKDEEAAAQKRLGQIEYLRQSVISLANVVSGPLASAFERMFATGDFGFKALGDALKQVLAKLVAAVAAAAALALIFSLLTGGTSAVASGGGFAKIFQGIIGGKGLIPRAKGGIFTGPSAALIGEYPGARNNPEVVAPLDKLKSLIGDSGAGSSGGFTGQLETRISGNDLVILMNRANKNRNGYY